MSTIPHHTLNPDTKWAYIVGLLVVALVTVFYLIAGPLVLILGSTSIISYIVWLKTTYRKQVDPEKVLPLFFLVIATEIFHQIEEVIADFPGEVSDLVSFDFTFQAFLILILSLAAFSFIAGIGLLKKHPMAYWFVWFMTIGPGLINFVAHITFPILNGSIYFPGLITVLIPTVATNILVL